MAWEYTSQADEKTDADMRVIREAKRLYERIESKLCLTQQFEVLSLNKSTNNQVSHQNSFARK